MSYDDHISSLHCMSAHITPHQERVRNLDEHVVEPLRDRHVAPRQLAPEAGRVTWRRHTSGVVQVLFFRGETKLISLGFVVEWFEKFGGFKNIELLFY